VCDSNKLTQLGGRRHAFAFHHTPLRLGDDLLNQFGHVPECRVQWLRARFGTNCQCLAHPLGLVQARLCQTE